MGFKSEHYLWWAATQLALAEAIAEVPPRLLMPAVERFWLGASQELISKADFQRERRISVCANAISAVKHRLRQHHSLPYLVAWTGGARLAIILLEMEREGVPSPEATRRLLSLLADASVAAHPLRPDDEPWGLIGVVRERDPSQLRELVAAVVDEHCGPALQRAGIDPAALRWDAFASLDESPVMVGESGEKPETVPLDFFARRSYFVLDCAQHLPAGGVLAAALIEATHLALLSAALQSVHSGLELPRQFIKRGGAVREPGVPNWPKVAALLELGQALPSGM